MPTAKLGKDTGARSSCRRGALALLAFTWPCLGFPADVFVSSDAPVRIGDSAQSDTSKRAVTTRAVLDKDSVPGSKPKGSLRFAPIATGTYGSIEYGIEQRAGGGTTQLQQKILFKLAGEARTYIWQPWIARVGSKLELNSNKNKVSNNSSSNNAILGRLDLHLVPYSRYPLSAFASRQQNYSGHGIGSLVSQTTVLGMSQQWTPLNTMERYQLGYDRSQADWGGVDLNRKYRWNWDMTSNRFRYHYFNANMSREREVLLDEGVGKRTDRAAAHHNYQPLLGLTVNSDAGILRSSDHSALRTTSQGAKELNSTFNFRPNSQLYSLIGTVRAYDRDSSNAQGSSRVRGANLNVSGNYRLNAYLILSASGNINQTNSLRSYALRQSANLRYPIVKVNLGDYRYNSQLHGSFSSVSSTGSTVVNGNAQNRASSAQTIVVNPGHSLSRNMGLGGGNLALGLDQSVSLSESTRDQATSYLAHSTSANWRRGAGSYVGLRLTGNDRRSLSHARDVYQVINASADINESFNRNENFNGALTLQATRQVTSVTPNPTIFSNSQLYLRYEHRRAFEVRQLRFASVLRALRRAALPVLVTATENQEQGQVTWENSLSYAVGKLAAEFRVDLLRNREADVQSIIALSLRRDF